MKLFAEVTEVKLAQARVRAARNALGEPVSAIFERSDRHPLTTVGIAAGVGFALGSLNLHPLRTPIVGPLLGGGLADAAAFATRWLVEEGLMDGFGRAKSAVDDVDKADAADDVATAAIKRTATRESATAP